MLILHSLQLSLYLPIAFGMSKNHYYDSDDYTGNGCVHQWNTYLFLVLLYF